MSKLISEPAAYVRSLGQANSETEAMAVLASAYVRSLEQPNGETFNLCGVHARESVGAVLASACVRSLEQPNGETEAPAVLASAYVRSLEQPNDETDAPVILASACVSAGDFTQKPSLFAVYKRDDELQLRLCVLLLYVRKPPLRRGVGG